LPRLSQQLVRPEAVQVEAGDWTVGKTKASPARVGVGEGEMTLRTWGISVLLTLARAKCKQRQLVIVKGRKVGGRCSFDSLTTEGHSCAVQLQHPNCAKQPKVQLNDWFPPSSSVLSFFPSFSPFSFQTGDTFAGVWTPRCFVSIPPTRVLSMRTACTASLPVSTKPPPLESPIRPSPTAMTRSWTSI
jgi:hypothetical protein